jgi:hypothetical protein
LATRRFDLLHLYGREYGSSSNQGAIPVGFSNGAYALKRRGRIEGHFYFIDTSR